MVKHAGSFRVNELCHTHTRLAQQTALFEPARRFKFRKVRILSVGDTRRCAQRKEFAQRITQRVNIINVHEGEPEAGVVCHDLPEAANDEAQGSNSTRDGTAW